MSVVPPAVKATTTFTGFCGQAWACAAGLATSIATASAAACTICFFIVVSSLRPRAAVQVL